MTSAISVVLSSSASSSPGGDESSSDWSSELSNSPIPASRGPPTKDRRTMRRAASIRKMHAKVMEKKRQLQIEKSESQRKMQLLLEKGQGVAEC